MNKGNTKNSNGSYEMLAEYDFSNGVRGRFYQPKKIATSLRLDDDVILFFKKKASEDKVGYQTLMNMALREFINQHAK